MYKLFILATISSARISAVKVTVNNKENFRSACNGQFNEKFSDNLPKKDINIFHFISNEQVENNIRQLELKNFNFVIFNFDTHDNKTFDPKYILESFNPEKIFTRFHDSLGYPLSNNREETFATFDQEVFEEIKIQNGITDMKERKLILLFIHLDVVLKNSKIISEILYPNSKTIQVQIQMQTMQRQIINQGKEIVKIKRMLYFERERMEEVIRVLRMVQRGL